MDTHDTPPAPPSPPPRPPRRWLRRTLIGSGVVVAVLACGVWLLGRESTLQQIVAQIARASGGNITVTGATGSLYGRMHIVRIVYRSPESVLTIDNVDINWSPLQYFSEGLAISELHASSAVMRSIGPSKPAQMPESLAPPFRLHVADARLERLSLISADGSRNDVSAIKMQLYGDSQRWQLKDASAVTKIGRLDASAEVASQRPFKLTGTASLTQILTPPAAARTPPHAAGSAATQAQAARPGTAPAKLVATLSGDLAILTAKLTGTSPNANVDGVLVLAPFNPVILRSASLRARGVDPSRFDPAYPQASLDMALDANITAGQKLSGGLAITNSGKPGPLDQQLLPLKIVSAKLGGTLTVSTIDEALIDFGAAGKFSGGGNIKRTAIDGGIDTATFRLHTDKLDLNALHTSANKTAIAGDIAVESKGKVHTLNAALSEKALRLDAHATLQDLLLTVTQARLQAKQGSVALTGQASLKEDKAFKANAVVSHFDPSALGAYPAADLNVDAEASGRIVPDWHAAAAFTIKPSKIMNQTLSGTGKLQADARHLSGIDAQLALGPNTATLRGAFGQPGEQLAWNVDGRQLSALDNRLQGALTASGTATGGYAAPRTSFAVESHGLAYAPATTAPPRKASAPATTRASAEPAASAQRGAQSAPAAAAAAAAAGDKDSLWQAVAASDTDGAATSGRAARQAAMRAAVKASAEAKAAKAAAVREAIVAPVTPPARDTTAPVRNAEGVIKASGELWLSGTGAQRAPEFKLAGSMSKLNPAAFGAPSAGIVNADFSGSGKLSANWQVNADLRLQPSTLGTAPLSGHATLSATRGRVDNADVDLHLGLNVLQAKGGFGGAKDRLDWKLDAPDLSSLGHDFAGVMRGTGYVTGGTDKLTLGMSMDANSLRLPSQQRLAALKASATIGLATGTAPRVAERRPAAHPVSTQATSRSTDALAARPAEVSQADDNAPALFIGPNDPLVVDISLQGYSAPGGTVIDRARLQTSGTGGAHTLQLGATSTDFDFVTKLHGSFARDSWTGAIDTLQNRGRFAFTLQSPASLRIAAAEGHGLAGLARPEQIALGGATIALPEGGIRIESLEKNGPKWRSRGLASGVNASYLAQLSDAWRNSVASTMTLGADWSIELAAPIAKGAAPAVDGYVHVLREKGDITVTGGSKPIPLGLRTLDARLTVRGDALRADADLNGARTGTAKLNATAQLQNGRIPSDSPLTISGNVDMPSIAWLSPIPGIDGLELDGALKASFSGHGTITNPALDGEVSGSQLVVNWPDQGIRLRNGVLQARVAGDQLLLQRLRFEGQQGNMQAEGWARLANGEATMDLKLNADKLEVLSRPDRTLVVSGSSTLVRDARHFQLDGKFRADRAKIELPSLDSPTISDDVIILGKDKPSVKAAAQSMPLNMDVEADLGDDFYLRGKGLDAQLAGSLRVRMTERRTPRVNGSIRVVSGTYAAYGQKLAIDRGVINFTGAYDNPGLNILAVRKRPEGEELSETNVEAGVEVRGTALAPVAKLVSTPSVPDSEKLSWLVLGHGTADVAGNEMALLGTAASALFGGKGGGSLANKVGLDELGVSQAKGLESTVVTVGKKLSSRAYLSFEQGASTATSLVKLRYKLNSRITLQVQTGTNNALDVLYNWAFD
ncbi:translocation/assembly module TamB domain-containing protein [Pseudoduganella sp. RAF19]|uniref:translocation/assembly module TamB domain-containing protein n=1 Tax=Pseudoduganella sp. RAF19 TaxID=3233052 RepID=UPI003F9DF249